MCSLSILRRTTLIQHLAIPAKLRNDVLSLSYYCTSSSSPTTLQPQDEKEAKTKIIKTKPLKKPRAELIKHLNFVNKEMFGELVESKAERKKRKWRLEKLPKAANSDNPLVKPTEKVKTPKALPMIHTRKIIGLNEPPPELVYEMHKNIAGEMEWVINSNPNNVMKVKIIKNDKEEEHEIKEPVVSFVEQIQVPPTSDTVDVNPPPPPDIITIPFPPRTLDPSSSLNLPSVSKILSATMSKEQAEILRRWEEKMIREMGLEGFQKYKETLFANGKQLHSSIELWLRGTPEPEIEIPSGISGHWSSLKRVLPQVGKVEVVESRVVNGELGYCGIVDCVAHWRDKLVVIDWKTSQKQKPTVAMTYDTPVQIAAYIGAINCDPNYAHLKAEEGLIVIAYEDGKPGHTFLLKKDEVKGYWNKWVQRLNLFQNQNQAKNGD